LLGVGIFISIRLFFPQKYIIKAFGIMKNNIFQSKEGISGFGTMMAALGGQLGTGSLVGVSSALFAGGPGAIFWMWATALFGMVITFSETILGQLFRSKDKNGNFEGGPSYYIEKGLKLKSIAILMSMLYVFGIGLAIASIQTNSIASAFTGVININPIIPGIIVVILAFLIMIGGMHRLSLVSIYLVPTMSILYLLIVFYIIITQITQIPHIFTDIFVSAFTFKSALGGAIGWSITEAFRNGVARGMFSNDAGNGTAAIMHASANSRHPVEQGFLGMLGTFITTIIICTATALAILATGSLNSNENGISLLQTAFGYSLGDVGRWVIFFAMFLFGFTTLLADIRYGESNLKYIFKVNNTIPIYIYRVILAIILILSSVVQLNLIWATVDLILGFIVFINVITLLFLFKYIRYLYNDYFGQVKEGTKNPIWNYKTDITKVNLKVRPDSRNITRMNKTNENKSEINSNELQ
jgi:AGCS family alanine or glycine:cation symporter